MLPLALAHASLLRAVSAVALVLGLGWTWLFAPPAAAAPATLAVTQTDPAGDARYAGVPVEAGADITGFTVVQDRTLATIDVSVTFADATFTPDTHRLRVALGNVNAAAKDKCQVWDAFGVAHLRHFFGATSAEFGVSSMTAVERPVEAKRAGTTFHALVEGVPIGYGFHCVVVTTERVISLKDKTSDSVYPEDAVVGFAPEEEPVTTNVPVDPGKGGTAPILDTDGDGLHDGVDKCPTAAGAATNGCENVPLAKSLRLGTKRLVVDRLLATTAGSCPQTVKIVAKLGGKTVGKQPLGTMKRGKFCHVQGVVKLKKRVKKARVTISGAGVVSVAATVAK